VTGVVRMRYRLDSIRHSALDRVGFASPDLKRSPETAAFFFARIGAALGREEQGFARSQRPCAAFPQLRRHTRSRPASAAGAGLH
jgi:hypothetical protein